MRTFNRSMPWSTHSSYRKSQGFGRYKSSSVCLVVFSLKYLLSIRTHRHIGKVIKIVKLSNVSTAFHFPIQNNSKNGNIFKKKLPNETIERLVSNKISSSSMNSVLARAFSIRKEHIFTINSSNFFELVFLFSSNTISSCL